MFLKLGKNWRPIVADAGIAEMLTYKAEYKSRPSIIIYFCSFRVSFILPLFAKPNLGLHFPVSFVEFFSYIGLNATAKKECIPPPVTYQQAKSQPKDRKNLKTPSAKKRQCICRFSCTF